MGSDPGPGTTGRRGRGERGAVLVETAILLPLILLLVFGIIEFSALYQSAAQVTDGTRASARTGSALARDEGYAVKIADAATSALSKMPSTSPEEIWIYRANDRGYPGSDGSTSFTALITTTPATASRRRTSSAHRSSPPTSTRPRSQVAQTSTPANATRPATAPPSAPATCTSPTTTWTAFIEGDSVRLIK